MKIWKKEMMEQQEAQNAVSGSWTPTLQLRLHKTVRQYKDPFSGSLLFASQIPSQKLQQLWVFLDANSRPTFIEPEWRDVPVIVETILT